MSNSPWNAYGRTPPHSPDSAAHAGPVADVVNDVIRGRERVQSYLDGVLREYFDIQSGSAGYRHIIEDALTPSKRPETIEERLARLARQAQARRRSKGAAARPRRAAR